MNCKPKKNILPIILCLLILVSCNNSEEVKDYGKTLDSMEMSISEKIEDEYLETIEEENTEKLLVEQKCIIFFMPTKKEIKKIIEHYGTYNAYDFQQLFADFKALAKSIKSNVKSKGIHSELTTNAVIEIKTNNELFVYKREDTKDLIGVIIYNGYEKPTVKYGMLSNSELTKIIRQNFELKNFENIGYNDSIKAPIENY